MKIEFKPEILEYANGNYYRKNDGQSFEVDARFAEELLASGYFQKAAPKPKEEKAEEPKAEKKEKKENK